MSIFVIYFFLIKSIIKLLIKRHCANERKHVKIVLHLLAFLKMNRNDTQFGTSTTITMAFLQAETTFAKNDSQT